MLDLIFRCASVVCCVVVAAVVVAVVVVAVVVVGAAVGVVVVVLHFHWQSGTSAYDSKRVARTSTVRLCLLLLLLFSYVDLPLSHAYA